MLEIEFNGAKIASTSKNEMNCGMTKEERWCAGNETSLRESAFNLLVKEYRRNVEAVKRLVFFKLSSKILVFKYKSFYLHFRESVMLILEVLIKKESIAPLRVKCAVRNGADFTESGSKQIPFKTVVEGTIHIHGKV